MENPFSLKGKTIGQTPNNFTIIKSIIIILVYVSWLRKNLSYFSLLSHTQIISLKGGNTLHSPFYFLLHAQLSLLAVFFSLSDSLLDALSLFSCVSRCCSFFFFFLFSFLICSIPTCFLYTKKNFSRLRLLFLA